MWMKNCEASCMLMSLTSNWSLQKSGSMAVCWLSAQSHRYRMKSEWQGARMMLSKM